MESPAVVVEVEVRSQNFLSGEQIGTHLPCSSVGWINPSQSKLLLVVSKNLSSSSIY